MTVDEVAEALRCSRSYVYVLHRREGLPFTRIGGRTVVRTTELERWLDEHTETA
jgi:excisionase family DNA binding protein